MRVVHKYQFPHGNNRMMVTLPRGAIIRHVAEQNLTPTMWIEHETTGSPEQHFFIYLGTGHPIPEEAVFLGTMVAGAFVWHVYEVPSI